jgi:hypothetical protein
VCRTAGACDAGGDGRRTGLPDESTAHSMQAVLTHDVLAVWRAVAADAAGTHRFRLPVLSTPTTESICLCISGDRAGRAAL